MAIARTGPIDVTVTVTETGTAPKTFQIEISEDPISLKGNDQSAVPIHWNIDQQSKWSFVATGTGIRIINPSGKFTDNHASSGNKRHTWIRNQNGADGNTYKYSISVSDGMTTLIVDPGIVNEA